MLINLSVTVNRSYCAPRSVIVFCMCRFRRQKLLRVDRRQQIAFLWWNVHCRQMTITSTNAMAERTLINCILVKLLQIFILSPFSFFSSRRPTINRSLKTHQNVWKKMTAKILKSKTFVHCFCPLNSIHEFQMWIVQSISIALQIEMFGVDDNRSIFG